MPRGRALLLALAVPLLGALALPATAAKPAKPRVVVGLLPGAGNKGVNHDAEPALALAPDGVLWATSNALATGCGRPTNCGSDVWRSRDGGRTWQWVANPFLTADPTGTFAMGGGDGDIAVAPVKNAAGHYNVYVASLWASNTLAVSRDGGESWEVQPLESAPGTYSVVSLPVSAYPDRPWIGADGACTMLFAYNEYPANVTVLQRYDACTQVLTKSGASLPFVTAQEPTAGVNKISGRFVVDTSGTSTHAHAVYYPAVAGGKVVVHVSTDGSTWTRRVVAPFSADHTNVPIWPVTAATDVAGRLYLAWHDTEAAYAASSTDAGATWSKPVRLNPPRTTATYPTVAAGASGTVVVLWYGTGREGPADDKEQMGPPASASGAAWQVWESRSANAGRTWTRPVALTGVVHRGVVCVDGGGCATDGSRNLLDDFGVVMDPRTSRVVSVFTTDQPGGQRTDRKTGFLAEVG